MRSMMPLRRRRPVRPVVEAPTLPILTLPGRVTIALAQLRCARKVEDADAEWQWGSELDGLLDDYPRAI